MKKLRVGDKAPEFIGPDQNGKIIAMGDFKGKKLLLYFYPKDNTEGCTAQSCDLRDHKAQLKKKGYQIIGVSADSERKHRNFINKNDLNFPLIADTERKIIEDYGVWGLKKFMGREYMGIIRTTFLIDEKGIIERVIDKVVTKAHSEQILNPDN